MTEQDLIRRIMRLSTGDVRLFRNNVGRLQNKYGGYVQYGLCPGSADLIGWRTIVITREMVGRKIAQFASIEAKAAHGRVNGDQIAWEHAVRTAGGLSAIVRSEDEVRALIGLGSQ